MVSAPTTLLAAIALAASPAAAFTSVGNYRVDGGRSRSSLYVVDDASARTLSDYMAKSHEEKLTAVKVMEEEKNSVIEALRAEISRLESSSAPAATAAVAAAPVVAAAPAPTVASPTPSELESKVAAYEAFISAYIVDSQNQKLLAVKDAVARTEKKFRDLGSPGAAGVVVPAPSPAVVVAAIAAPAAAEEIAAPVVAAPVSLRAILEKTSFQHRNEQVIASARAGKSRWGNEEIRRAIVEQATGAGATGKLVPPSAPLEAEAEASPPSLDDRVNLGARLIGDA